MKNKWRALIEKIEWIDSIIGLFGVALILFAALFMQYFYKEDPCPLCLLQRAAFVAIGICFLMNIRYGNKVSHWAMAIICALSGVAVSIRQILLHITSPEGFGSRVFGLHMYTWCFIAFMITILGSAVMLLIYPEKDSWMSKWFY